MEIQKMPCTVAEPSLPPRDSGTLPSQNEYISMRGNVDYGHACAVMRQNPNPRKMVVWRLFPQDVPTVVRALADCACTVKELWVMNSVDMPEIDLCPLLDAVAPSIKILFLNDACKMESGSTLQESLKQMHSLHTLRITDTPFDEATIAPVCEYLVQYSALRELEVGGRIGDATTACIARACHMMPGLRRLILDHWAVGELAGTELVTLIETTESITHFRFQNHRIPKPLLDRMYAAFRANPSVVECRPEYGSSFNHGFELLNNERRRPAELPAEY